MITRYTGTRGERMKNLLDELMGAMARHGIEETDVKGVGSGDGVYGMSWKDFRPIAEHTEYSNVDGEHNITPDLYVSMNDGSWLQYMPYRDDSGRHDIWEWELMKAPDFTKGKPFKDAFGDYYGFLCS